MKRILVFSVLLLLCTSLCFADDQFWTFDTDISGWNSPVSTWASTITWNGTEGHTAAGSIECTDSDVWAGARNTVTIGAGDPGYLLTAWVKIMSADATHGLALNTWNLDRDNSGGTTDPFDVGTIGTWQSKSHSGNAGSSLVTGYIMINTAAPWGSTDPATYLWYIDDVSYDETPILSVEDWSLYSSKAVLQ